MSQVASPADLRQRGPMDPTAAPDILDRRDTLKRMRWTLRVLSLLVPLLVGVVLGLPRFQDTFGFLQERRAGSPTTADLAPLLLGATGLPMLALLGVLGGRFLGGSPRACWRWALCAFGSLVLQALLLTLVALATPDPVGAHRFLLWGGLAEVLAMVILHRHLGGQLSRLRTS